MLPHVCTRACLCACALRSISPAEFSRASTADTLPWNPSPEPSPSPAPRPSKKAKCPHPSPVPSSKTNGPVKRELFPTGSPRPTCKVASLKTEWVPPDPSTRRVPELTPLVHPDTPLDEPPKASASLPKPVSPPLPPPAKMMQVKQEALAAPMPKAIGTALTSPPAKTTSSIMPATAKHSTAAKTIVTKPASPTSPADSVNPYVTSQSDPPTAPPTRPPTAPERGLPAAPPSKATAAPPPILRRATPLDASEKDAKLKEITDDIEAKLSKLDADELDNALCEAMVEPQFQDYMKFLQKDLGFESVEEVESQWGTNDPYYELLDFCVWLEQQDLKAASKKLTPATVATPQKQQRKHVTWAPEVTAPKAPANTPPPAKAAPARAPLPSVKVSVADTSQAGYRHCLCCVHAIYTAA